jgi:hypothetical protein
MTSKTRLLANLITATGDVKSTSLDNASGGGGATSYANAAALPTSGNTAGDLAFTLDKKALYNWDGSEWDRIYSGPNETLTWDSALPGSIPLSGGDRLLGNGPSAQTILNFSAKPDTEGFPVTYSYEMVPSFPAQLDSAFGDDSASGGKGLIDSSDHPTRPRITLLPSISTADVGDFVLRVKATDGTHVITSSALVALGFLPREDNIKLYYNFSDTSSFSTATAVTDISTYGNTNNGIITNGTINESGLGGVRTLGIAENSVLQVSSAASIGAALTFMVIMSRPADSVVLMSNSNGGSAYLGVVKEGDTSTSQNAQMPGAASGYTADMRINGNTFSSRGDGWSAFEADKFNSWSFRGYDWTGTNIFVNGYATAAVEWKSSYQILAVLAWDVYLTDAELRTAHNSFANMATMDL